jgi:hypothetical protein
MELETELLHGVPVAAQNVGQGIVEAFDIVVASRAIPSNQGQFIVR